MVVTADINFVDEGEVYDFKGYYSRGDIVISKDTTLVFGFEAMDKYGNEIEGPGIGIHVNDVNGIHEGAVYTIGREGMFVTTYVRLINAYSAQGSMGSGELRITTLTENRIKGTFEFTAVRPEDNVKTVIISNGKFDSAYIRQ